MSAFADGFGGGLIGGLFYCMVVAYFDPGGVELAWMRVVTLSLTFGGFETWRVTRQRTLRSVRAHMALMLTASLIVLWALGAVIASTEASSRATPPHFNETRFSSYLR